ncbi:insulysin [Nematocida minor]|uniref:insulysin n=1 Tax=Nematocida minor TaxID=1912983 RepID=UPI00221FF1C1|nr:insulysin [Nematocida minor]KAI5192464.1 insulysin [Nematocida minor]
MVLKLGGRADKYEYRALTLSNKIRVLLSHDPKADKAAVSMSVKVGSYSDPKEHPGMAHFLEHMLFMGTEEYPDENAYMEYIHINNGNSNANTSSEVTNYFYDIDPAHLKKSMQMFSGFFKSPLIREDAISREIQAVNSEHSAYILSEEWRRFHLLSLLSKPGLPTGKFSVGSVETLASATREDLHEFWKCFYTPDRMCLAVHGSEPLDVLQGWVEECFKEVKSQNGAYKWSDTMYLPPIVGPTSIEYYTFDSAVSNQVVLYRPAVNLNTDHCSLTVSITLPENITKYRKKSCAYFEELLNGTGSSGFVGTLLKEGIITDMCVYVDNSSIQSVLYIVIELAEDNRSQIPVLLDFLHHYIEMIKTNATEELYEVFRVIDEKVFETNESAEPLELVETAAYAMQFYPTEEFLKYDYIWDGFDEEEFHKLLDVALDKSKWVVLYRAKNIHNREKIVVDEIYGINYLIEEMPEIDEPLLADLKSKLEWCFAIPKRKSVSECRESDGTLELGTIPNSIPDHPEENSPLEYKEVMRPGCIGYLVQNAKYRTNAQVKILLETDLHLASEKVYAAAIGYFKAFVKIFNEKYKTNLTSSIVTLSTGESVYGLLIKFNGTPILIEDAIEKFFAEYTARNTQLFNLSKESALSHFLQDARKSPYKSSVSGISHLAGYPIFDIHSLMKAAKVLSPEDLVVISKAQVKILGVGNITEKEFSRVIDRINKYVTFTTHEPVFSEKLSSLEMPTVDLQNIAVTIVHKVVADSLISSFSLAVLLVQIFSEKFFDELRTKEEYGYIVFMSYKVLFQKVYVHFTVQSTRDIENVANRITTFVKEIQNRLSKMAPEEYLAHKSSAIAAIKEEALNLEDYTTEVFNYWLDIGFHIDNKELICQEIEKISQESLTAYTSNLENIVKIQASKPMAA